MRRQEGCLVASRVSLTGALLALMGEGGGGGHAPAGAPSASVAALGCPGRSREVRLGGVGVLLADA